MTSPSNKVVSDVDAYLKEQETKGLLRFITCGSVDDGKSTLIGRLLWDSKLVYEDQLSALETESKQVGTQGENVDFALLLDGLQAEREQGITIDVAYRYFSTDKRKFIVADTPGHEQYTRNMATGAANAELAVILVDARTGILTQTRRHSYIASLLGIKKVVLAVNKMDLIEFGQDTFETIKQSYQQFANELEFEDIITIPVSALNGDNVIEPSPRIGWYSGPTLLDHLETVDVSIDITNKPFRMPVQWVNRPNLDFRGFSGTIVSGSIKPGDKVAVPSSGYTSRVTRIVTSTGDLEWAGVGHAVTLTIEDEIDISRGDMLVDAVDRPIVADQFEAKLIWMSDEPMLPSRSYQIKLGTSTAAIQVSDLKYKVNVNTLEHLAGKTLELNEVGVCNFSMDRPLAFDSFQDIPATGRFILIDRLTNATVGAGVIDFALRRSTNIHLQALDVNKQSRAKIMGQKPCVIWFTGLSGSGKSTIANLVEKKLHSLGNFTYTLDGDNVRHGLNRDLGFTDADRVENIRRVGETAKMFVDSGMITLVSFISPFTSERQMARQMVEEDEFVEVFVDTSLEECERRDFKGLYAKARSGELKNFTGIDSDYEAPDEAEININGDVTTAEQAAEEIVAYLQQREIYH